MKNNTTHTAILAILATLFFASCGKKENAKLPITEVLKTEQVKLELGTDEEYRVIDISPEGKVTVAHISTFPKMVLHKGIKYIPVDHISIKDGKWLRDKGHASITIEGRLSVGDTADIWMERDHVVLESGQEMFLFKKAYAKRAEAEVDTDTSTESKDSGDEEIPKG